MLAISFLAPPPVNGTAGLLQRLGRAAVDPHWHVWTAAWCSGRLGRLPSNSPVAGLFAFSAKEDPSSGSEWGSPSFSRSPCADAEDVACMIIRFQRPPRD